MSSLRVLVIERDADKMRRISSVLRGAQYEVLPAESFSEGMEALHVQRFDAVLIGSPGSPQQQLEFIGGLRRIERSLGILSKTPVLLCVSSAPNELSPPIQHDGVDAYLPGEFVAATFTDAVVRLANAVSPASKQVSQVTPNDLPLFEPEKFRAQVAYDKDLLVEIIDLFLGERHTQIAEMRAALALSDFTRLSRVAHTMKGSLGSLHAAQARAHAQELESAAKSSDGQVCRFCVAVLDQDLDALEPLLLALRSQFVGK